MWQEILGGICGGVLLAVFLVSFLSWCYQKYRNIDSLFEMMSRTKVRKKGMDQPMTREELDQDSEFNVQHVDNYEFLDERDNKWKPLRVFYKIIKEGPDSNL